MYTTLEFPTQTLTFTNVIPTCICYTYMYMLDLSYTIYAQFLTNEVLHFFKTINIYWNGFVPENLKALWVVIKEVTPRKSVSIEEHLPRKYFECPALNDVFNDVPVLDIDKFVIDIVRKPPLHH